MQESRLLRRIIHHLQKLRLAGEPLFWFKTHGNPPGIPDIIICHKGKFIGIELKAPSGKLRRDQECISRRIIGAGGKWSVVKTIKDLEEVLFGDRGNGGEENSRVLDK